MLSKLAVEAEAHSIAVDYVNNIEAKLKEVDARADTIEVFIKNKAKSIQFVKELNFTREDVH